MTNIKQAVKASLEFYFEVSIDYIEREYRNGKIQYLDLITALNNLADAQIKYYSAALDIQTVKYTSLYHHGKLYEELLK